MALFDIFDLAGSGMRAQSLRLNVTASNLANADNVATRPEDAYRSRHPVFSSYMENGAAESTGVRVLGIVEMSEDVVVSARAAYTHLVRDMF